MRRLLLAMAVMVLCLPVTVFAQTPCTGNLIVNGDFEAGNTGFTSDYSYSPPASMYDPKTYVIGSNPHNYHSAWASFGDHTTGSGNMMIVNATCCTGGGAGCTEDCSSPNDIVWQQTVTVKPYTLYVFKYSVALSYVQNPPTLQVSINGKSIGNYTPTANQTGEWEEVSYPWYSGSATSATITLVDLNPKYQGDDYCLDDIQLCPEAPCAEAALLAGQNTEVGRVYAYSHDGTLYVTYEVEAPWCFTELHLAVANSLSGIPQKNGNPIPGKFPYKYIPAPGACEQTHTFEVPVSQVCNGGNNGDNGAIIAAHAKVKDTTGYECTDPTTGATTTCYRTETAWAQGTGFEGANWAMYFDASDCCSTNGEE